MELFLFIPFGLIFVIVFMSIFFMNVYYIAKNSSDSEKDKKMENFKPYEVKHKRNEEYKVYNIPMLRESKSNTIVVPDEVSEKESSIKSTQNEECKVYKKDSKNTINSTKEYTIEKNKESKSSTIKDINNINDINNDSDDGPIKENNGIFSNLFGNKPDEL